MPKSPTPTALDLFADLNAALDGALIPQTPDRAALEVPCSSAEWMVRDFGKLMQSFEPVQRTKLLHQLLGKMVQRDYPAKVMGSVLNASGVSPEEMQAYRLQLRTPVARSRKTATRL